MNGAAYIMVILGILLAKGLGFLRDIIFASVFGATEYTDMYFQIFGLVNLIFTGIGVALSTLVIKNMNKEENALEDEKRKYVSYFITKTSLWVIAASALLCVFASPVVKMLLPGLDSANLATAVKLMYIMIPSFLFVIIAYIISGVLQNNRVFFVSSIMSLPFNVVIIASLFVKNIDIITVGIVTTIGWFLHIVIQLPSFYKKGYALFKNFSKDIRFKGKNAEIFYIFISNMMFQVCFMIDKAFVSAESGAATTINYSSNLFVTISSVFVVAMSNVVFPSISKNYEEGNIKYVRELLKYILTVMAVIFSAFIMTTVCFGKNIIALLYERGEFTGDLTNITAILFAVYTMGALGYICQELLNKILYLDLKYKYTVIGTIAVIILKIPINYFAVKSGYGAIAVALTTTGLFILYGIGILMALCLALGNYFDKEFIKSMAKILLSSAAAVLTFFVFKRLLPDITNGKVSFLLPLAVCAVVYIAILLATGMVKKICKRSEKALEGGEK